MSCSTCGSWNQRQCNCPTPVNVVTKIVDNPCLGCTTLVDGKCVFYKSTTTPCLGIKYGDNYDSIIQKIDTAICVATACTAWTTITLLNGASSFQARTNQKIVKTCGDIKFRGAISQTITIGSGDQDGITTIAVPFYILPAGQRPPEWVNIPVSFLITKLGIQDTCISDGNITILPTGEMFFTAYKCGGKFLAYAEYVVNVFLDNIEFSTLAV